MNLIIPPEGQRPGELKQSSGDTVVETLSSSDTVSADTDTSALISGENVEEVIAAAYASH